ncbi:peptidoglycan-binding protein [Brevundimonas vesicularis]|uniref:peptidoglycan-binding protein n=1 Tax=Brevundimonas vesicularis TaxID=41276 RepID=UPI00384F504C
MKLAAEKDIAAKIAAAKAKLVVVETRPNPVAALGAAALAATAAVLMAGVVIIGPGVHFNDPTMTISR